MEYQDTLPGIDRLTEEAAQRAIGQEALFIVAIIEEDE